MTTLTADLSRLQKERDMAGLTEIRETMEDVRESVYKVFRSKKTCGVPATREEQQLEQIDANIILVEQSIRAIS